MFERAKSGALDQVLPGLLVSAFKQSEWYPPLRVLRDELTHADIGSVHEDPETGFVSYTHTGLGPKHQALIIETSSRTWKLISKPSIDFWVPSSSS
jgi:hypothetical protein